MPNWADQIDFFHVKGNEQDPQGMRIAIDRIEQTLMRLRDNLRPVLDEAETNDTNISTDVTNLSTNVTNLSTNVTNISNTVNNMSTTIQNILNDISDLEDALQDLQNQLNNFPFKVENGKAYYYSGDWICLSHW